MNLFADRHRGFHANRLAGINCDVTIYKAPPYFLRVSVMTLDMMESRVVKCNRKEEGDLDLLVQFRASIWTIMRRKKRLL